MPVEIPPDVWREIAKHLAADLDHQRDLWALVCVSREIREACFSLACRRIAIRSGSGSSIPRSVLAFAEEIVGLFVAVDTSLLQLVPILRSLTTACHNRGDVAELMAHLATREEALRRLMVACLYDPLEIIEAGAVRVRALSIGAFTSADATNIVRALDPGILVNLSVSVARGQQTHHPLGLPLLPSLRTLILDVPEMDPEKWLRIGASHLVLLHIRSSRDDQRATRELFELIVARFPQLRSLIVLVGLGYELVPWLALDETALSIQALHKLERLCMCATQPVDRSDLLSNASDGFYSPASAHDARGFGRLPALREVVFGGRTRQSVRRAYAMPGGLGLPIELPHDDGAAWEHGLYLGD